MLHTYKLYNLFSNPQRPWNPRPRSPCLRFPTHADPVMWDRYVYIHTYTCIHIYTHLSLSLSIYIYIYIYIYRGAAEPRAAEGSEAVVNGEAHCKLWNKLYVYIYIYVHIMCLYMCIYIYIYIFVYTHDMYIYIYIYIYISNMCWDLLCLVSIRWSNVDKLCNNVLVYRLVY